VLDQVVQLCDAIDDNEEHLVLLLRLPQYAPTA
jgi:hypothetical protein